LWLTFADIRKKEKEKSDQWNVFKLRRSEILKEINSKK